MIDNAANTTKRIASNTIYQIVGKVFSMSVTVAATMIITRIYGAEGYGEFSLMQTWPALFFVVLDFGLNAIATRELSKDWERAQKIFGNIFLIRLLFSILLIILVGLVVGFFPYENALVLGIRLSLLLMITQALFATTNIIFQVKLRYDYSTIGYGIGYILILALIVLFSLMKFDVIWVNFSYVLGGILTVFINIYYVNRMGIKLSFDFDPVIWKYYLVQSLPLGLMFIFSQINFKSDTIMLSALKLPSDYMLNNKESVAVYNLGYKIFEVLLVIPTFLMNSVYPVLVRHLNEDAEKMRATLKKTLKFLLVSGLFMGILAFMFAPPTIRFLGGEGFLPSVGVLRILMTGLFIYYLTQPLAWVLVTLEEQSYLPAIYLISAVFNVTANYFLIPKYSFYASAWITHVSEIIILVLLFISAQKIWKKKYGSNLI